VRRSRLRHGGEPPELHVVRPLIVGNRLVFRDDNHITFGYAEFLAPVMGALLDRELARG
jgi:hypothetical protein